MISAIGAQQSTNFRAVPKIGAKKVVRQVVSLENSGLQGLSHSKVKFDSDGSDTLEAIIGALVGTSAVSCLSDFCNGVTIGSQMV